MKMSVDQLAKLLLALLVSTIRVLFLLAIVIVLMQRVGKVQWFPALGPLELLYLAGAFWLVK